MHQTQNAKAHFQIVNRLTQVTPNDAWDLVIGEGPVVATAIHDGHRMRNGLLPHLAFDADQRRRDEDPMTGILTSVADVRLCVRDSRFQSDLNRPRDKAISADPDDTWGLKFWKGPLPPEQVQASQAEHDTFYAMVRSLMDALIERWDCLLVFDIHSYNHRRDGTDGPAADNAQNPDIDLGVTTLDAARWRHVAEQFASALRETPVAGRAPDVRENVRYPDGGYFPEWLHRTYGDRVCTITLEYKKIYMDEWTAQADISVLEDLRSGLDHAVRSVREQFLACR